ncbi:ABC transporter permease [Sporosarcina sp. P37]|uniref:ABC transporter permease n=1 Tax=unclassified Sporosarcina TaxID=2647733 RepID=UPI000A17ECDC|nr:MULTISPECIES: ABC transporter permease [unclassified Sporosarcina]ARK25031.1 ABC transporter permease [Sporosarcina sp. P37]PID18177.1 ABC transporter permease [Sporosarcina sp. P35]
MKIAWKEMKKSKAKFLILGSIIFLVSFLTFIISGLANGLSQDNAALIKNLPQGQFYLDKEANQTYNLSKIDEDIQKQILIDNPQATAFSVQMGFVNDAEDKQHSVAFVASAGSKLFEEVTPGEIILDSTLQDEGIKVGDVLTNHQFSGEFIVKGFVDQQKYSHAPAAFIHKTNYQEIYRVMEMQTIFIPGTDTPVLSALDSFSNKEFLNAIPSYSAEQMSLNMIIWFLVIISGMLFAIFFYMMNVQKIGLYGILKAIGMKTTSLFKMIWYQMLVITAISLALSIVISQGFNFIAPEGMPFHLTMDTIWMLSAVFIVVGFTGATISGFQIKKIEPLQAIQQGEM